MVSIIGMLSENDPVARDLEGSAGIQTILDTDSEAARGPGGDYMCVYISYSYLNLWSFLASGDTCWV